MYRRVNRKFNAAVTVMSEAGGGGMLPLEKSRGQYP